MSATSTQRTIYFKLASPGLRRDASITPRRLVFFLASLAICWTFYCYRFVVYPDAASSSSMDEDVKKLLIVPSSGNVQNESINASSGEILQDIPRLNIENDADDGIASLVAILPVTESSLAYLDATISVLLQAPGILSEIILLSPSSMHQDLRNLLGQVFFEDSLDLPDVSVATWPNGLEEGVSVLQTARQISADRFLLMDANGLNTVDASTREMLVGSFATPLPVGPRGFNSSNGHFLCILANEHPQASAFLLPPFSVSSLLVPPHDLELTPVYDIWSSLGHHISRARFERVGGVVVAGNSSIASSWCSGHEPRPQLEELPFLPSLQEHTVVIKEPHPTIPSNAFKSADYKPTHPNSESLALLVPSFADVYSFAPAICRMQRQSFAVRVLVAEESVEDSMHLKTLYLGQDCNIDVHILDFAQSDAIVHWLSSSYPPRVILHSGIEGSIHHVQLTASVQKLSASVFVGIPRPELRFCDWMGTLTMQEWRNWHIPRVDVSIITNDRSGSLSRLLHSLKTALLFGDKMNVRINIEQTADSATLDVVDQFFWEHGAVFIHRRVIHGGLLPAVVESWYPSSDDTYGLLLEDDVELSPLFYAWIKMSLLRYRYGSAKNMSPRLFGISLYQQKNLELRPEGRHRFNARAVFSAAGLPHANTPFLSQIPCSWGAVYFPEHWRAFHAYLAVRLAGAPPLALAPAQVVAPGVRSNRWTRSWKKYFIELVFLRGGAMLYPNYARWRSLSTNHLELGSHVRVVPSDVYERKKRLYRLPLLGLPGGPGAAEASADQTETGLLDLPEGSMPPWETLPVTDLFGLMTSLDTLKQRGDMRRAELFGCQGADSVPFDVRKLLCLDDEDVEDLY